MHPRLPPSLVSSSFYPLSQSLSSFWGSNASPVKGADLPTVRIVYSTPDKVSLPNPHPYPIVPRSNAACSAKSELFVAEMCFSLVAGRQVSQVVGARKENGFMQGGGSGAGASAGAGGKLVEVRLRLRPQDAENRAKILEALGRASGIAAASKQ